MGRIIDRRRVCGSKKEDTYIQNGLVFWLDGIDKGDDPTAWTDLVGGAKFAYNQHSTVNTDNVAMDGAGAITSDFIIDYDCRTSTIEVVCNMPNVYTGVIFFSGVPSGISFMYASQGFCYASIENNQYNITKPTGNVLVSMSDDDIVLNGATPTFTKITNLWKTDNVTSIGGRAIAKPLYFKACTIYAIRIYNRKLSTTEMIANQRIDNVRFNLGLNI